MLPSNAESELGRFGLLNWALAGNVKSSFVLIMWFELHT